jgi:hypothetical protein
MTKTKLWPRVATLAALTGALWLGGCAAPTPPPSQAQQKAQQMEVMRLTMISTMQRDEFVEGITSMKRDEPVFPAVKSSLGVMFSDPVIVDWIVGQVQRDRAGFSREWVGVTTRGFLSIDDATALKLLMPISYAAGRMSAAECQAIESKKTKDKSSDSFMAMLRAMKPHEVNDFFDGMRTAVVAGIRGAPLRPVSTPAQTAQALSAGTVATMNLDLRKDSCGDMARVAVMLDKASPQDRTHLLNYALTSAGLVAQTQVAASR